MDDNTYSRIIGWLKIALPLLALAILSTLFLVARNVDPAQQLPFADVDVEELAREQRIGAPNFTGMTPDGAAIALSAVSAGPDLDQDGRMTGESVRAAIDLPNGERIDIAAGAMELNYEAGTAQLMSVVEIVSDAGYSLRTARLQIALDRTRVASDTPAIFSHPLGELTADSFELRSKPDDDSFTLDFKGDVKLVYTPER